MVRLAIALLSIALAGGVAACGGSSPAGSASTRASRGLAFAKCMRSNGVPNFPDPGSGGNGIRISARSGASPGQVQAITVNGATVSGPAFRAAMAKCARFGPGGRPTAAQIARLRAGALAMAKCMRAHGVANFPDPTVGRGPFGGIGIRIGAGPGSGVDMQSPAVQSALRSCGSLFGKGGP